MEIVLADGSPFLLTFPLFVPVRPDGGAEPVWYPGGKAVPVYTDADLARSGMASQGFDDLVPLAVPDEPSLRHLVAHFQRLGANHLAIDICTAPGRPGGHLVPVATAFGG
jgi:hypothetical protein